jgi:hypothetical protein
MTFRQRRYENVEPSSTLHPVVSAVHQNHHGLERPDRQIAQGNGCRGENDILPQIGMAADLQPVPS